MTDQIVAVPSQPEEKSDTYHNQDTLMRVSVYAERISWLFLVLTVFVVGVIFYLIYLTATGRIGYEQLLLNIPTYLVPFFLGGFFWILLRSISEGVYILMDIEDNTRKPT